jgi:hypothetical protein
MKTVSINSSFHLQNYQYITMASLYINIKYRETFIKLIPKYLNRSQFK